MVGKMQLAEQGCTCRMAPSRRTEGGVCASKVNSAHWWGGESLHHTGVLACAKGSVECTKLSRLLALSWSVELQPTFLHHGLLHQKRVFETL
jgi:hypothetical protein